MHNTSIIPCMQHTVQSCIENQYMIHECCNVMTHQVLNLTLFICYKTITLSKSIIE